MIDVQRVADLIDVEFPDVQLFEAHSDERLKQIARAFLDAYKPLQPDTPDFTEELEP